MAIPKDIKKSTFVEVLSAESTDRFDFVRAGQNLAISFANLATALGVSGTLQTLGEITAVPVLTVIADINYIRNILAGSGIATTISPQNGVQIDHNFTVDKTGVPVMINEGAASPTFRSISAGTGITVGGAGNEIQISTSGTPGSTKTIQVFDESDFPAPIAGVITLADDTEYFLQNDITTANRFVMGEDTVLKGADAVVITLTYTGVGTLITATDKNFKLQDLHIIADTGTLFNVTSTTVTHIFRAYNMTLSCYDVGNFESLLITYLFNAVLTILNSGFTFTGTHGAALFDTMSIVQASGSSDTFDLGSATFSSITLSRILFTVNSSGYLLSGLASSGNITANGLGSVFNCLQLGSATFLDPNITSYDDRWEMFVNPAIINSFDLCLVTHAGATIAIATAATPVIIGATWVEEDAHRFSTTVGGRFTYNGKGTHCEITASISASIVTATDNVSFFVYINGVQITNSRVIRSLTAGSIANLSLLWDVELNTGDYIEIWTQNDDTNVDVIIDSIKLRIRS